MVLEEVGGGLLHREGDLRVGDAEDAVPGEEKLGLLLAKSAGGDEDELLELAAGLEVGVLVAELDALAEEAAANLDVRVGGVGILEAELLAEVAERLGLPALHGIVAHGDDALEVGVVELGDRLGAILGHVLHAKLGSDGVHVRLGDGRGIAVQHAVPERLGRGGDALLVRGGDGDGGAGAEARGEHSLGGVGARGGARGGANREGAADDDAVGAEAGLAEGGLLRLELIHVLLELVGRGAALRLRLRGKTREGQRRARGGGEKYLGQGAALTAENRRLRPTLPRAATRSRRVTWRPTTGPFADARSACVVSRARPRARARRSLWRMLKIVDKPEPWGYGGWSEGAGRSPDFRAISRRERRVDAHLGGRGGAGHVLDASGAFREARDAGHADAAGGEAGGLRRLSGRSLLRRDAGDGGNRLSRHLHGQELARKDAREAWGFQRTVSVC